MWYIFLYCLDLPHCDFLLSRMSPQYLVTLAISNCNYSCFILVRLLYFLFELHSLLGLRNWEMPRGEKFLECGALLFCLLNFRDQEPFFFPYIKLLTTFLNILKRLSLSSVHDFYWQMYLFCKGCSTNIRNRAHIQFLAALYTVKFAKFSSTYEVVLSMSFL